MNYLIYPFKDGSPILKEKVAVFYEVVSDSLQHATELGVEVLKRNNVEYDTIRVADKRTGYFLD